MVACTHAELDTGDRDAVMGAVTSLRPDAIAHCAAWTNVDGCESDHDRAFRDNALANRWVMDAARRVGAYVVALSTDYVFDGEKDAAYHEWDTPNPQSVYGESKLAGEFEIDPDCGVVRTSWVCGRHGANMVKTILRLASQPGRMRFVTDQRGSPTIVPDLVVALRSFVVDRLPGTWHVTNQGALTWYEFARVVLTAAGDDPGTSRADHDRRAQPASPRDPSRQLRAREPRAPPRRPPAASPLPRLARRPRPRTRVLLARTGVTSRAIPREVTPVRRGR